MFKKEKTEDEAPAPKTQKVEETAYEDSWYRSLKAKSQRPPETDDEEVGAPED
jgi:hypothetical protein